MISILTPTRGRPDRALGMVESAIDTSESPRLLEFLFYVDDDDPDAERYRELLGDLVYVRPHVGCSKAWNFLAAECTGDLISMGNDDVLYKTEGWDSILRNRLEDYPDQIVCFHFDEGIFHEKHCAFPIITRRWYEAVGYTYEGFKFYRNDTWIMDLADRIGRRVYIPEVLTDHMHADFNKGPKDTTSKRNKRVANEDTAIFNQTESVREKLADKLRGCL